MAHYVILNFEDENPAPDAPLKRSKDKLPTGIGGAAAGTLAVYKARALRKSKFLSKKEAVYYPCQELIAKQVANTLTQEEIVQIRKDCAGAKTISIVVHGRPDDVDNGFATSGGQVCTWAQLGDLALLLFPASSKQYNVALIMCYGARSQEADLDHRGQIPAAQLRTSFAYKLFKAISEGRSLRMSAWTGAVSNDGDTNHMIETEEEVFLKLDQAATARQRTLNKKGMDEEKERMIAKGEMTKEQLDLRTLHFFNNPNEQPTNAVDTFVKDYMIYGSQAFHYLRKKYQEQDLGARSKYGKLLYARAGANLAITARYQTSIHGANYELYSGPML